MTWDERSNEGEQVPVGRYRIVFDASADDGTRHRPTEVVIEIADDPAG